MNMKTYIYYLVCSSILGWFLSVMFELNFVGILIVNAILSFAQTNYKFPWLRFGSNYFFIYFIEKYLGDLLNVSVLDFYTPSLLWKILIGLGFLAGLIAEFGRKGNGTQSKSYESVGNFFSLVLLALAFVFFWWHGGVAYLIARIPFIFIEGSIINFVMWKLKQKYEGQYIEN